MVQAQDAVNSRVKELIEEGYVLPEEVAEKYSKGVSEASLALQAIEFGDAAEAKKHMIFALQNLREVLRAVSEENVERYEQTEEQQAASDSNSDIVGTYNWLQRYYYRLQELAEKNQVDRESQFRTVALLLTNAKAMIDEGNFEDAERNLGRINTILEDIRAGLFDEGEGGEKEEVASDPNSTGQADEELARKLTEIAAEYEKDALELLNEAGSNTEATAKVQEALSLIANAKISIDAQDLESARSALREANHAINEAEDLIEDESGGDDNSSGSGGSNSGKGNDDDDDKDNDPNDSDKDGQ
jgi:hypothetical protein